MATFDCTYIDINGKRKKEKQEGESRDKVLSLLKIQGKIPLTVTEQNLLTKEISFNLGNPVKPKNLAAFCRQFHSILTAGITIINALDMLGNETENKILAQSIKKTKNAIEKGESLAAAMRSEEKVFPPILIHMVEAGEISGNMNTSLLRMSGHFEKDAKLRATIRKATIYPVFVGIVSFVVILVMLIKIIPTFMEMFTQMDMELPAVTKTVLHMSDFAKKYWLIILAVLIFAVFGFKRLRASEKYEDYIAQISLKIPVINKLVTKSAAAKLGRTLSTLLASGISVADALEITAKGMTNTLIKKTLINAKSEVERGIPMSDTLQYSKVFPPMAIHLIRIGEQTGNTEQMLEKVADYYEEEVENATNSMLAMLEPLMIILLALIVGFILFAMFSPMLSMYKGLKKM